MDRMTSHISQVAFISLSDEIPVFEEEGGIDDISGDITSEGGVAGAFPGENPRPVIGVGVGEIDKVADLARVCVCRMVGLYMGSRTDR